MKNMGMNHMDKQINTQSKSTSGTTGTGMQSSPPLRTTLSRQNRVQQSSNQMNIIVELRTFPDIIDPPVEVREMLPTGNFNAPIMEAVP
jgi:hypothetical protein